MNYKSIDMKELMNKLENISLNEGTNMTFAQYTEILAQMILKQVDSMANERNIEIDSERYNIMLSTRSEHVFGLIERDIQKLRGI